MKYFIGICFWVISLNVCAQMITAPVPLTIEANASNVDAGDFVVNWANTTDQILVSISLEYQNGATFSLPVTTGLTLNTGYTSWTGVTSIVFLGTRNNINTALAAMTMSMGAVKTAVKINLEVAFYDSNYKYNPNNKHFYRYIAGNITYANAKSGAATYSYMGKTGYLLTITSQDENNFVNNNISGTNIWLATTDVTTEGNWIIDAGPELGTPIKTSNGQLTGNIAGQYNNWCSGEPNDANNEDYATTKWNGGTCWNDLPNSWSEVQGYVVEISEDFPAGSSYTGVYATYTVHNNDIAFTVASANNTTLNSSTVSNYPNLFGGLQINSGNTVTLNSSTTLNTNKIIFNGTGKLVLTDNTSKWTPGTSSTTNTFVHSPTTNSTPNFWSVSSSWNYTSGSTGVGDPFYENAPYPGTGLALHQTPYLNSPQGWSAQANNTSQFIQLSYPVPVYMTGLVLQGRAYNGGQWVTTANVDVSLNGTTWTNVLTGASFNTNSTDAVTVLFPSVVYARFVRISPTAWNNHITMRMGAIIKSTPYISDGLVLNLDASNLASHNGNTTTWKDLSSSGFNGTLTNGPTYNIANRGFVTLDGVDDYVNGVAIPSTSGNNSRTVMIWYKSTANKNTVLLDKGNVTDDTSEQLFITYSNSVGTGSGSYPPTNNGGIAVCFWGSDLIYPIAASTLFDGNWHFVAYTYDNANRSVQICFDGKFATSVYQWNYSSWSTNNSKPFILPRVLNTTSNPYWIGRSRAAFWGYGGTYSNVNIPMVQIYNRALTEAEILTNFNATRTRYGR